MEATRSSRAVALRRLVILCILAAFAVGAPGCMQYRQTAKEITPAGDCPDFDRGCSHTVWGLAWGLAYANLPEHADCGNGALQEVTVRTGPGYFLISLVTLGLVAPRHLEWKCAAPVNCEGELSEAPADTAGGM